MNDTEVFTLLGWALLEWKMAYYRPHLVHRSWGTEFGMSDTLYEAAEDIYKELARKLGKFTYVTDLIEIDETKGNAAVALGKLSSTKADIIREWGKAKPTLTRAELIAIPKLYHHPSAA
jgi:hypothetical protein